MHALGEASAGHRELRRVSNLSKRTLKKNEGVVVRWCWPIGLERHWPTAGSSGGATLRSRATVKFRQ